MARRGRRCSVAGCGRWARKGSLVCRGHEETGYGVEADREVRELTAAVAALQRAQGGGRYPGAAGRFRERVERGEFSLLFAGKLEALLKGMGEVEELTQEKGALRVAMVRLLLEEDDPARLAQGISRVATALTRVMKLEAELGPGGGDWLDAAIDRAEQVEAEQRAEREREAERRAWEEIPWKKPWALDEGTE
jgi:hypothetical protein